MSNVGTTVLLAALIAVGWAVGLVGNRLRRVARRREETPSRAVTVTRVSGWSLAAGSALTLMTYSIVQLAATMHLHPHVVFIHITS